MKKRITFIILVAFFVVSIFGATVYASYGDWVPITGDPNYYGCIRSGWFYSYPNKTAHTEANVFNVNTNNATYHYSRVQIVNSIIPSIIYADSGRQWSTYTSHAQAGPVFDDSGFAMRPYWGLG